VCAACSSPAEDPALAEPRSTLPVQPERSAAAPAPSGTRGGESDWFELDAAQSKIGELIRDCDGHLRTWADLMAQPRDAENLQRLDWVTRAFVTLVVRERAALEAQATSGGPRNRAIASASLGFSGDPAVLPFLTNNVGDADVNVAAKALLGLGVLAHPATPASPLLDAVARPDATPELIANAAFAAFQIAIHAGADPTGEWTQLGLRLALNPDAAVRAQAALCLGLIRAAGAEAQLCDLLALDPAPGVRTAAAYALGQLGASGATTVLVGALKDSDRVTAGTARASLTRIHGQDLGAQPAAWSAVLKP
jgi:HEAT repeat protein